jgi:uncharacterized protein
VPAAGPPGPARIGLISDTHGLLRPEAMAFLRGCDHIVHAGDIGKPDILDALGALAPLTAIRGNIDTAAWAAGVPDTALVELAGIRLHVLHDLKQLALDPAAAGVDVVVSGHSHRAVAGERDGVLYVNPGSAGPRRFRLPVTIAEIMVDADCMQARIHTLLP